MSRIEAGKIELALGKFSVLNILERVGELFSSMAFKKGLEIVTFVDPKIPIQCIGDATRVSQVLNNFVSNAIKYTSHGHVLLTAELQSETETHSIILFKCIDTGKGIAEEALKNIFVYFVQLQNTEGWGIGLPISKRLVELMNGKIGVESQVGKGSTFWISIPFQRTEKRERISDMIPTPIYKTVAIDHLHGITHTHLVKYIEMMGLRVVSESENAEVLITSNIEDDHFKKYKRIVIIGFGIESIDLENNEMIRFLKQPVRLQRLIQLLCNSTISELAESPGREIQFKNISVLLVEDNLVVRNLLKNLLKKSGIQKVDCVSNGKLAIQAIETSNEIYGN